MAGFRGELGAVIKKITVSKPSANGTHDLTFITDDGAFLHIVGDNNMVELLEDALDEYSQKEYEKALKQSSESNSLF